MAAKYTKKQIMRNRIAALGALAVVLILIIILSVSCTGQQPPAEYTESGPPPAGEGTTVLTGKDAYDFGAPVPEAAPVGDGYFSNSVFIGQSQIGGMRLYTDAIPEADISYSNSASVANGINQSTELNGTGTTINDVLTAKQYQNIYLHFGLNELGFSDKAAFKTYYSSLVAEIRELQPDAAIYLLSVLPMSQSIDSEGTYTVAGALQYNDYIQQIAAENSLFYLDIASIFTGADGFLDPAATDNGLNIKVEYYTAWREYLLTHTAPEYAR